MSVGSDFDLILQLSEILRLIAILAFSVVFFKVGIPFAFLELMKWLFVRLHEPAVTKKSLIFACS